MLENLAFHFWVVLEDARLFSSPVIMLFTGWDFPVILLKCLTKFLFCSVFDKQNAVLINYLLHPRHKLNLKDCLTQNCWVMQSHDVSCANLPLLPVAPQTLELKYLSGIVSSFMWGKCAKNLIILVEETSVPIFFKQNCWDSNADVLHNLLSLDYWTSVARLLLASYIIKWTVILNYNYEQSGSLHCHILSTFLC
jgi:hypothetical protein